MTAQDYRAPESIDRIRQLRSVAAMIGWSSASSASSISDRFSLLSPRFHVRLGLSLGSWPADVAN